MGPEQQASGNLCYVMGQARFCGGKALWMTMSHTCCWLGEPFLGG